MNDWTRFLKDERQKAKQAEIDDPSFETRWGFVTSFIEKFGQVPLASLSPDYESTTRLQQVFTETKQRLLELHDRKPDLIDALKLLTEDNAVRVMTIHKSKGLEFESVVILGVEQETFWGNADDERCAFFVGISRAKKHLVLTVADQRPRPAGFTGRWTLDRTPHEEFLGYAEEFVE